MVDWSEFTDKFSVLGDRFGRSMKSLFGSKNERVVRDLEPLIKEINGLESWAQGLDADAMRAQTAAWKEELKAGTKGTDDILPQAFALVREASVRTLGLRHFDVQLVGGIVLHNGSIAEMATGEGKTLVATLPLYLNALTGEPVYLITVNDYLAKRDSEWMAPIFEYLGLSVGAIQANMPASERLPIYHGDIVYGTNNEFGFDYLRDNMKMTVDQQVQRHLSYAIIDEIDSVLIDEARTPLIISGPAEYVPDKYAAADMVANSLERDTHYEVKEKERAVSLLEDGIVEAQELLKVESFYTPGHTDWPHYIENALRAKELYEKDREYVVEEGQVVIVDENTGRKMEGRRWSDGLHQAVETKEKIEIRPENQTLATITLQNYFRTYKKLAGMTGTAITEANEFHRIYGLDVLSIPTNLPIARDDAVDTVYRTEPEKWQAICDEIARLKEKGQPVLVGTTSVENSEKLSAMLKQQGVIHEVLNAKAGQIEREAQIVALAGDKGSVTVSTNMAGRGTDIKLGGNFEYRLARALEAANLVEGDVEHLEEIARIRDEVREKCDRDEQEVLALGGLYVLGTERHESRRIDNQLRGRSGRQGNVGESRFFLSLQDPLMRRFYKDWVTKAMERLGMKEGVPIESPMVTRAIEKAQRKVEDYYFEMRKNLLEYDEVMDEQRKTIYGVRQETLEGVDVRDKVTDMLRGEVTRMAETFADDADGFAGWFTRWFGFELPKEIAVKATLVGDADPQPALDCALKRYEEREAEIGEGPDGELIMRKVDRHLLLHAIDAKWMDHLRAITALRQGIGLRGYAQRDPKNEYKAEGFKLFEKLLATVEDEVTSLILRVQVRKPGEDGAAQAQAQMMSSGATSGSFTGNPQDRYQGAKPQRNEEAVKVARAMMMARAKAQAKNAPASDAFSRKAQLQKAQASQEAAKAKAEKREPAKPQAPKLDLSGVGRNEACPCGSGKKFKKCHGAANA